ncbi:hypothetical protein LMG19089_02746 [Ralstonia edaphis]|uniref:transglutaminase-like domain-containing protein n=1 Tax=Ralstonia TaxID=48736 RepID=UPI0011BD98B1|nr:MULTISPECIES: transglutaminase family protein [unclassified Ralstonia]TXD58319.1 transglutaminase family protein [Ralstonia sp. TCR112]CAJ0701054.1 hypothetical protein LMG19089_02746 [Ralstonia sp. LMG 6871]HWV04092.1 transglutaminase family protein [Ralstonia sp.]
MVRMRYSVRLAYEVRDPTADFIFNVHAAKTSRQTIVAESLHLTPAMSTVPHTEPTLRNRRLRVRAPRGNFTLTYEATVDIEHLLTPAELLHEVPIADLPLYVVPFLTPSRYCESDRLMEFAQQEFGGCQRGYPLVIRIRDWVCRYVRFVPQSTSERTSAVGTLVERKGVCRDYAHLMIALCRALSIPARFATSLDYGADPSLGLPDFHAFVEVFLGNQWYLVDPSQAAVPMGLLRIGTGRDAADVPIALVFGNVKLSRPIVEVQALENADLKTSMPIDTVQGISTW